MKVAATIKRIRALKLPSMAQKRMVINLVKANAFGALGEMFFQNFMFLDHGPVRRGWSALWKALPKDMQQRCDS